MSKSRLKLDGFDDIATELARHGSNFSGASRPAMQDKAVMGLALNELFRATIADLQEFAAA